MFAWINDISPCGLFVYLDETNAVLEPAESLFGAATVLSGIPFYILWRRSHKPTPSPGNNEFRFPH